MKRNLLTGLLLLATGAAEAQETRLTIDTSKASFPAIGSGRISFLLDRQGYEKDDKDLLPIEAWAEGRGKIGTEEALDRTIVSLNFYEWPAGKELPTNPAFLKYRAHVQDLSKLYHAEHRKDHPWDALAFFGTGKEDFDRQVLCWNLPHYAATQKENFLPAFLKERMKAVCSKVPGNFFYPVAPYLSCDLVEGEALDECLAQATDPADFSTEFRAIAGDAAGSEWIPSWSHEVFDPSGSMSAYAFPFQSLCSLGGFDHAPGTAKANLYQFRESSFLKGINKDNWPTDWNRVMLACSQRFADIISSSPKVFEDGLKKPPYGWNPWLDSLLHDLAKGPDLITADRLADDFLKAAKSEIYGFAQGYTKLPLKLDRVALKKAIDEKKTGQDILPLVLTNEEFQTEETDLQLAYISRLCPKFGKDIVEDARCLEKNRTPRRLELKRFGSNIGYVRYGYP